MSMFVALLQIIFVFGIIGFGVYYFLKKMKNNQFNKIGDKGKIQVVDGVNLTYQTSCHLLNVEGQKVLVILSPNGTDTIALKDKSFGDLMNSGFEVDEDSEINEEVRNNYENE